MKKIVFLLFAILLLNNVFAIVSIDLNNIDINNVEKKDLTQKQIQNKINETDFKKCEINKIMYSDHIDVEIICNYNETFIFQNKTFHNNYLILKNIQRKQNDYYVYLFVNNKTNKVKINKVFTFTASYKLIDFFKSKLTILSNHNLQCNIKELNKTYKISRDTAFNLLINNVYDNLYLQCRSLDTNEEKDINLVLKYDKKDYLQYLISRLNLNNIFFSVVLNNYLFFIFLIIVYFLYLEYKKYKVKNKKVIEEIENEEWYYVWSVFIL